MINLRLHGAASRAWVACAAAVWFAACPVPSGASDLPPIRADQPPFFHADLAISIDPQGRPGLSVGISVPYDEFQWVKVPKGFAAGAEISVAFRPLRGGREFGDAWQRRMVVGTFDQTNSNISAVVERRSFDLPPGRFEVRVTLRDANSGTTSTAAHDLEVPDYSNVPVGIADLELGLADSTGEFSSLPGRNYGPEVERLAARVALFDRRPGSWPRTYPLKYRILGESGETVREGERRVNVSDSAQPLILKPDSTVLFVGNYVLEVELLGTGSRWRVERSFEVEHSAPPTGRELETLIEPLALIADPDEVDSLLALPPAERSAGWERFWSRRDPNPDTPRNEAMLEFLDRVRYANRHFREVGSGWRSDRGRIHIRYGAPDQIENRPSGPEGQQVEIWYYNRPYRRFVFVDRDGFGRYALVSPWTE